MHTRDSCFVLLPALAVPVVHQITSPVCDFLNSFAEVCFANYYAFFDAEVVLHEVLQHFSLQAHPHISKSAVFEMILNSVCTVLRKVGLELQLILQSLQTCE